MKSEDVEVTIKDTINEMTSSQIALSAARFSPSLFRPLVRAALWAYPYRRDTPHWVLLQMKEDLAIRINKRMEVDGFTIEADPYDGPGHKFWRSGLTEPETRNLLSMILKPEMVMLDVGAYVGQFSLVASRAGREQVEIWAFEPTPAVYQQLRRNIELNRCAHVTCVQAALSDKPGRAKFYFYPESHDQNSLRPLADPNATSVEVAIETIDSTTEKYSMNRVDLIKVDVEGNELAVLRGGRECLARFRPTLIIEVSRHQQVYGYTGGALKELLTDWGYNVYRIGADHCAPYIPTDDELVTASHFNVVATPNDTTLQLP